LKGHFCCYSYQWVNNIKMGLAGHVNKREFQRISSSAFFVVVKMVLNYEEAKTFMVTCATIKISNLALGHVIG